MPSDAPLLTQLQTKGAVFTPIFAHLFVQLIITMVVAYHVRRLPGLTFAKTVKYLIFLAVALLVVGFTLAFTMFTNSTAVNVLLFTLYSSILGGIFGCLRTIPADVMKAAGLATVGTFAAMFLIGCALVQKGVNLSNMGMYLNVALIGLIMSSLVFFYVKPSDNVKFVFTCISIVVFALYVVWETSEILTNPLLKGKPEVGAFLYYEDIVALFFDFIDFFDYFE